MTAEAAPVAAFDLDVVRQVLQSRSGERVALSHLFDSGAYARSFALPRELDDALRWVEDRASSQHTVSIGVASLSEAGGKRLVESSARTRPRAGEHAGYSWVAADLDPKVGQEQDALHAQLGRFPHPPTLLASSGRGLHAWWHLAEPVNVETGRALCQDLARALSGDPGAADEGRCLRLPGTFNPKERVRRLAKVLDHDQQRRYAAATLTAAACELTPRPVPPAPRPRRVLEPRSDIDAAEQLRQGHDLGEELDRIAGPRRLNKWRCPAGHDETASLGLHRDDAQRWVCFGGSHPAGVGRATKAGQYSGDVIDLLALEANQPVDRFLADEHIRLRPSLTSVPPDRTPAVPEEVPLPPEPPADEAPRRQPRPVMTLAQAHAVFARWLGHDYDLDALDATLAAAAVERLDGDPIWLLIISGSGNAKTETVQSLDGIHSIITSTISSEGALLSATSAKEKAKDATGGLLRKIGGRGVLVIKDLTSVLSMSRDQRAMVLGALREVYDGRWSRNVGTDGGRTLEWSGRIVCIGAVTTKWDQAHDVIAAMGDRFVLLRMDSTTGRQAAGRKAIGNTGSEIQMRTDLAEAVAGVMAGMRPDGITVTTQETDVLLAAADVVTLARTGVEYDYRGDVIDAHAPEMPTRFAKQLAQVVRGGVAIGMPRQDALCLAIRCARDSMPPMRLAILDDVAANPGSKTADVRRRLGKPRATIDRQLQALHMLGVLEVEEEETEWAGRPATVWRYQIAQNIDPKALSVKSVPDLSVPTPDPLRREEGREEGLCLGPAISGTDSGYCLACGEPLNLDLLAADGIQYHPSCGAEAS